jgi:uncharacterized protein HemX
MAYEDVERLQPCADLAAAASTGANGDAPSANGPRWSRQSWSSWSTELLALHTIRRQSDQPEITTNDFGGDHHG